MNFLKNCTKGIALGAGAILPGISSGVLCVIFGIYEKLLDSILNFFSDVKKNIKFLFPLVIGGAIGVFIFGNILNYFFYRFPLQVKSIFIGLILGSIPELIKEINKKGDFKIKYCIFVIIAFCLGIAMVFLENLISINYVENSNIFYLVLAGLMMSVGVVVPGVSSTIILMLMGVYTVYLQAVSNMYMPVLIPMGVGLIVGGFIFMKITQFLLKKFYVPTFYVIIGFTLGSIFVLLPEISTLVEFIISIMCICLGIIAS